MWGNVGVCRGMWAPEAQWAEAFPVIGANAAFNNRTKGTGSAYVLKMCIFPQNPLSLWLW